MAIPAAANALTSPQTRVNSPTEGSVVTADVTVRGSASHGRGVAEVRLVFKNLDDRTFWNGGDWQDEFVRFSVPLDRPGAKQTSWSYVMPWEEMTGGNYRARAFARSVDGNGDSSGGDRREFSYRTNHDLYDTEITGPTGTISGAEPITIVGRGHSSEGVALVRVAIHHRESKQYWNGESQRWQKRYVNSLAELDEPGANDVKWQVVIPADSNLVGRYTLGPGSEPRPTKATRSAVDAPASKLLHHRLRLQQRRCLRPQCRLRPSRLRQCRQPRHLRPPRHQPLPHRRLGRRRPLLRPHNRPLNRRVPVGTQPSWCRAAVC